MAEQEMSPELAGLENEAIQEEEEALEGQWQPEDEVKKEEEERTAAFDFSTADLLGMAIGAVFELVALRVGESFALQEGEAETLGAVWEPVADRYLPDLNVGPLPVAFGMTAMIMVPKVKAHKQAVAAARKQEEEEGQDNAGER